MRKRIMITATLTLALIAGGCRSDSSKSALPSPAGVASPSASASQQPPTGPDGSTPTAGPSKPPQSKKPPASGGGGMGGPLGTKQTTGVRAVALTFDDGPHPTWTPKVLDDLRAAGVKATFCLVGLKARQNPELVARIVREGHTLCNHSWQHDLKLGQKPEANIRADLVRTNEAIQKAVPGAKVTYYRQPGGMWTPSLIKVATDLGMTPLHWDVDPKDWDKPGTAKIIERVEGYARPGSIVLMHDAGGDRSETLAACPQVIAFLKKKYGIVLLR